MMFNVHFSKCLYDQAAATNPSSAPKSKDPSSVKIIIYILFYYLYIKKYYCTESQFRNGSLLCLFLYMHFVVVAETV